MITPVMSDTATTNANPMAKAFAIRSVALLGLGLGVTAVLWGSMANPPVGRVGGTRDTA